MEDVARLEYESSDVSSESLDHIINPSSESISSEGRHTVKNHSKDSSRKKRSHKSAAKLKQTKLDVRREQFLAQVTGARSTQSLKSANFSREGKKDPDQATNEELTSVCFSEEKGINGFIHRKNGEQECSLAGMDSAVSELACLKMKDREVVESKINGNGIESHSAAATEEFVKISSIAAEEESKPSSPFKGLESNVQCTESIDSIKSEANDDESVEDDWEAAADALKWDEKVTVCAQASKEVLPEPIPLLDSVREQSSKREFRKPTIDVIPRSKSANGKAWRMDDAFRPLSLPRSSRNWESGPSGFEPDIEEWRAVRIGGYLPSCCPICTEELDMTDSSFSPCSCGFRLCLFCHHRIANEDGRCPGCRRPYSEEVLKLSRANGVLLKNL